MLNLLDPSTDYLWILVLYVVTGILDPLEKHLVALAIYSMVTPNSFQRSKCVRILK